MYQAIFLDRDGTIGGDHTIHYPGEFQLYQFTKSVIELLKEKKIKIFSFTNQPGISSGMATETDFINELKGFGFDDVYICPHSSSDGCSCRKPNTGMLLLAAKAHSLDLEKCVVIGDRWSDIVAASKVGCTKILVQTGAGKESMNDNRHLWGDVNPDYVAEDLEEAVKWLFR